MTLLLFPQQIRSYIFIAWLIYKKITHSPFKCLRISLMEDGTGEYINGKAFGWDVTVTREKAPIKILSTMNE
jgi:hypothetical protein